MPFRRTISSRARAAMLLCRAREHQQSRADIAERKETGKMEGDSIQIRVLLCVCTDVLWRLHNFYSFQNTPFHTPLCGYAHTHTQRYQLFIKLILNIECTEMPVFKLLLSRFFTFFLCFALCFNLIGVCDSIRLTFHSWPLWSGVLADVVDVRVFAFF